MMKRDVQLGGGAAFESGGYVSLSNDGALIEGDRAFLHRFAAAGAAVRYRAIHGCEVEDIVALDVALRRNDRQWTEHLPPEIETFRGCESCRRPISIVPIRLRRRSWTLTRSPTRASSSCKEW
jgi:D-lactate dehydrogenase, membrane binding